jgi:hypothetical protein
MTLWMLTKAIFIAQTMFFGFWFIIVMILAAMFGEFHKDR